MVLLNDLMEGVAYTMEQEVPDLTTALDHEADPADNAIQWPHGEIVVVSNARADPWNTDKVGYVTDTNGNQIGEVLEARFDLEIQMNIWIAVPNETYDIQVLGETLERGFRKYDVNHTDPQTILDPDGGVISDQKKLRITGGGELPTNPNADPPHRGYGVMCELRFKDVVETSEDYIETVDIPDDGDLTDGSDQDAITIEYNA